MGSSEASSVDYDAVRAAIKGVLEDDSHDDGSYGPIFVRLAWHSSGTYCMFNDNGGSAGSRMRFSPEGDWGANAGLSKARDRLEPVKKAFPDITYSDLWILAGIVAIEEMGGPKISFAPGRADAADGAQTVPDGRLPDATRGADHLRAIFYRMGFNDRDIVALSGAHGIGRCHKTSSGFDGPWAVNPTNFSNTYYRNLLNKKWTVRNWDGPKQYEDASGKLMMLPTDMVLLDDADFLKWVKVYAEDKKAFFKDFAAVFQKLVEGGTAKTRGGCPVSRL